MINMKLKKILKYIDSEIDVRIWYADHPAEKYKMWTGEVFKIPKKFKKYQLVEAENNNGSEAMFPMKNGKLRITIVKKQ